MRLKVGDSALIINSRHYPDRIGQVCTVIGPYELRMCTSPSGVTRPMYRYRVRHADGVIGAYSFRNLSPIGGRQDELVDSTAEAHSSEQVQP